MQVRARLNRRSGAKTFADFEKVFETRRREADEFYAELQNEMADPDARGVQRQALAGMIWSKQFFYYDVREWVAGDPAQPPPPPGRKWGRNHDWQHLNNAEIISMPDKWEYPWYAAWDLAFHCIPLAMVDAEFAKAQLVLLTREWVTFVMDAGSPSLMWCNTPKVKSMGALPSAAMYGPAAVGHGRSGRSSGIATVI